MVKVTAQTGFRRTVLPAKTHRQFHRGFLCAKASLVIELDGGQHFEPEQQCYDRQRTAFLQSQGLSVLRFTNLEVLKNIDAVMERVFVEIGGRLAALVNLLDSTRQTIE